MFFADLLIAHVNNDHKEQAAKNWMKCLQCTSYYPDQGTLAFHSNQPHDSGKLIAVPKEKKSAKQKLKSVNILADQKSTSFIHNQESLVINSNRPHDLGKLLALPKENKLAEQRIQSENKLAEQNSTSYYKDQEPLADQNPLAIHSNGADDLGKPLALPKDTKSAKQKIQNVDKSAEQRSNSLYLNQESMGIHSNQLHDLGKLLALPKDNKTAEQRIQSRNILGEQTIPSGKKSAEQRIHCVFCPKNYSTTKKIIIHVNNQHPVEANITWIKCFKCHFYLPDNESLATHPCLDKTGAKTKSPSEKNALEEKIECIFCGNMFATSDSMTVHVNKKHLDLVRDMWVKCLNCDLHFVDENDVDLHSTKAHSGKDNTPKREKMYACQVCSKVYSTKQVLTNHINRIHNASNSEKISCKICDSVFSNDKKMSNHMLRVHKSKKVPESLTKLIIENKDAEQQVENLVSEIGVEINTEKMAIEQDNLTFSNYDTSLINNGFQESENHSAITQVQKHFMSPNKPHQFEQTVKIVNNNESICKKEEKSPKNEKFDMSDPDNVFEERSNMPRQATQLVKMGNKFVKR